MSTLPVGTLGTLTDPSSLVLKLISASLSLCRNPPASLKRRYTLAFPTGLSSLLVTTIFRRVISGSEALESCSLGVVGVDGGELLEFPDCCALQIPTQNKAVISRNTADDIQTRLDFANPGISRPLYSFLDPLSRPQKWSTNGRKRVLPPSFIRRNRAPRRCWNI